MTTSAPPSLIPGGQPAFKFGGNPVANRMFNVMEYINWNEYPLGNFNIYRDKKNNVVNCYDQVAAVQALCGVVGIKTEWVFSSPYGFIKTSNLVGVGSCNNPFFKNIMASPELVVDKNDSRRSSFANHVYFQLSDKLGNVVDACAGPHTGTENMRGYLQNAIDTYRSLTIPDFLDGIEIKTRHRPKSSVKYYDFLLKVLKNPAKFQKLNNAKFFIFFGYKLYFFTNSISLFITYAGEKAMINNPLEQRTKSFEKKIDFERALSNHVSSEKIVFDWSTIENPPHLVGWELTGQHHETTGGPLAQEEWKWVYKKNEEGVGITIISHKIGEQSALFAIRDFANNSNMLEPPYLKGPTDLGTVSVVVPVPYGYEVHWAYRDLEFSVEATDKSSCLKTAYWLNSVAQAHRKQR